jgi:hypothetical protein
MDFFINDPFMYKVVKESIETCRQFLVNNDVQAIHQWWIVKRTYGSFENMTYASYGPRFYIEDFGFLTEEECKTIYDLDKKNASIFASALETGDLSQLPNALINLDKIASIYKMI